MPEQSTRRWTGAFGLASASLFLISLPMYFMYAGAPPDWNILTRILLGLVGQLLFLAFLAGFGQLLRRADAAYEWVANLAVLAGVGYFVVSLVALSLEAGTTISSAAPVDPTVDGALAPGQFLMQGAIGRALTAVFALAAGHVILRTGVLPAWAGRWAYVLAALNLAFVPSVYFGSEATDFYSAVGWGTTALGGSLVLYWVIAVSLSLVRKGGAAPAGRPPAPRSSRRAVV